MKERRLETGVMWVIWKPWYCSPIQTRHFLPVLVSLCVAPRCTINSKYGDCQFLWGEWRECCLVPSSVPFVSYPCKVATPNPSPSYEDRQNKSNINQFRISNYASSLLCTLALEVSFMSTIPGMQAIQTPCIILPLVFPVYYCEKWPPTFFVKVNWYPGGDKKIRRKRK